MSGLSLWVNNRERPWKDGYFAASLMSAMAVILTGFGFTIWIAPEFSGMAAQSTILERDIVSSNENRTFIFHLQRLFYIAFSKIIL